MALALEKPVIPGIGHPEVPATRELEAELNISVVFTSLDATFAALEAAVILATRLRRRITLVVPQMVPYPLPLTSPPVLLDWNERRVRQIASRSPVETSVELYLCRDRLETLKSVLSPRSMVVVGRLSGWWPFTQESELARQLRRAGHEVILAEKEQPAKCLI